MQVFVIFKISFIFLNLKKCFKYLKFLYFQKEETQEHLFCRIWVKEMGRQKTELVLAEERAVIVQLAIH